MGFVKQVLKTEQSASNSAPTLSLPTHPLRDFNNHFSAYIERDGCNAQ